MFNYLEHTVKEVFRKGTGVNTFGVEVETEGLNVPLGGLDWWSAKPDGSLRNNGIEFVSGKLDKDNLSKALSELKPFLPACDAKSPRTSTHVHVDVAEMRLYEVYSVYTLTLLLQDLLQAAGGSSRVGNNFALSYSQAPNLHRLIVACIKQGCFFHQGDHNRYSFVNFVPLTKFGTVEFRFFRGLLNVDSISRAVQLCTTIKDFCVGKTPKDIVQDLLNGRIHDTFNLAFFKMDREDFYTSVDSNLSLAYEVVSSHPTEWDFSTEDCDWRNKVPEAIEKYLNYNGYKSTSFTTCIGEREFKQFGYTGNNLRGVYEVDLNGPRAEMFIEDDVEEEEDDDEE